jgi:hypothetical protein
LLPQIELPRFPDQCLSELIVLFRGDELESGALVDAAGRRKTTRNFNPRRQPLYVAVPVSARFTVAISRASSAIFSSLGGQQEFFG